jgi:repressor of nif and glnA expression
MNIPDHIAFLAEQLLPQFIPKDTAETTLSFQFTMVPNKTYRVSFDKTTVKGKVVWVLVRYEDVVE